MPVASSEPRIVLGRHDGALALAFSPDGAMLAGAFSDHTTVLWDIAKRGPFETLRGHRERVVDVAFSPDGGWIATASLDYTIRIWDAHTGQNIGILPGSTFARRVRWSPTGEYLATSPDASGAVFLYLITGRRQVQQWLTGHRVELACVAAHPRHEQFMTSGYSELIAWAPSISRRKLISSGLDIGAFTSLAYSADGSRIATASWHGADPRQVVIRDADAGTFRSQISTRDIVYALAFDPDGERLACGDIAGNVVVWDLAGNRPIQKFATGSDVRSIVFLDHPLRLVTQGANSVLLFNLETGKLEKKVEFAGERVQRFAADQARGRLVVGFRGGAIGSVSLPDLTRGLVLEGAHGGSVDCLALSPDGHLLATGGTDHQVVLRDAKSFELLLRFPSWAGSLRDMTFDHEGRRLAIVGSDCNVSLWDISALSDGLMQIRLGWDRLEPDAVPSPVSVSEGEQLRTAVPTIRRNGNTNGGAAHEPAFPSSPFASSPL